MAFRNWPGKWRVYQMLYLAFAATIALYVQNLKFPLAGNRAIDNSTAYLFQSNVWSNEVFRRLEEISHASPYNDLSLTQERQIGPEYLNKISAFHAQIRQILRLLSYQGNLVISMTEETAHRLEKIGSEKQSSQYRDVLGNLKLLEKEAVRQQKMQEELEAFDTELRSAYAPIKKPGADNAAQIAQHVQQVKVTMKLFTKPELLLRPNESPLAFLSEFGKVQSAIFKDYSTVLATYNQRVEAEEFQRNLVLIVLSILTACLMLNAELRAWQHRNQSD